MELDNNAQTPAPDDAKRLAEAKRVTIQPLHPEVAPEELPDSQVAAEQDNSPTIGNVAGDIEQNASPVPPARDTPHPSPDTTPPVRHSSLMIYLAAIILGIGIISTGFLFFMV